MEKIHMVTTKEPFLFLHPSLWVQFSPIKNLIYLTFLLNHTYVVLQLRMLKI